MTDYLLNKKYTEHNSQSAPTKYMSVINGVNLEVASPAVISAIRDRDVFLERSISQCIIMSQNISKKYSYIYDKLDEASRHLFRSRIQELLTVAQRHQEIRVKDIVLDAFSESSLVVSFENRKDLKLTINIDEPDYLHCDNASIENVEVAYLSFKSNGKRHTINNTFHNIIIQLLDMYA